MDVTKIVIGLGFGDEGKGMAVAHGVERSVGAGLRPVVVRFNGGPQAAHNVRVRREGKVLHHRHSQFGSGALLGADTYLTRGMLFDPMALVAEAKHLSATMGRNMLETVSVGGMCPVVLPIHVLVNRELERRRGDRRHGSTGSGIGVARACEDAVLEGYVEETRRVTAYGLLDYRQTHDRMMFWKGWLESEHGIAVDMSDDDAWEWAKRLRDTMLDAISNGLTVRFCMTEPIRHMIADGTHGVTFEGSQGILLDERFGWFPHVTYGDMTASEATRIAGHNPYRILGVTRSYQTRHGAGPLPGEYPLGIPEPDNGTYEWAGKFRTGYLDMPTLAKAARWASVDEVAVSHMDDYPGYWVACWKGEKLRDGCERPLPYGPRKARAASTFNDEEVLLDEIERRCNAPVTVVGRGPITEDWTDR